VLVNINRVVSRAVAAVLLCSAAWAQAPAQPQWKDRAEYDLVESINKTTDPAKKIELLNQWEQKYPQTDFAKQRVGMFLQAYQQAKDLGKMADAANKLMAMDPKDVPTHAGLIQLALQMNNPAPEVLGIVEKASQGVVANIDNKPAAVTDEQWKTQRGQLLGFAYKSLGYVAQQRKDTQGMIDNYVKSLQADPNQGTLSYALGQAILAQKNPETYPLGLFHVARAAVYDGPSALPPADRKKIDDYLGKAYEGFHGDRKGLEENVKAVAKANAVPPPGWTIKSVKQIAEEKLAADQKLAEQNPKLAFWVRIRDELKGEGGQAYFDSSMKDAEIPVQLVGYVVEQRPKEIVLAMSDRTTPEVTLVLDTAIPGKLEPGAQIDFENAVGKSFTKDPFMVVMEVERKNVKGLPAAAGAKKPAAAKKPGGAKRRR
jgi:tetratricopeptide (TPR) repeat protein